MDLMSTAMPYGQTKSPTTAMGSSADLSVPIRIAGNDSRQSDGRRTTRREASTIWPTRRTAGARSSRIQSPFSTWRQKPSFKGSSAIGICQDTHPADLIQERNRLKTAVELIEKEITASEQRTRDLYLKRAADGMSIDDFNSALSRIKNDVDKLRLKSKRASRELLHLNESIAAESVRMETVLKAADFNRLDKAKVSMLIESVYVHKRDPKSGTQAIDITWKF